MRRRSFTIGSLASAAVLSLLAAGCGGGSSPPGVANVASSTTTATTAPNSQSALVSFSQCMRTHGVPSFPDPQRFVGGNVKLTIHQLDPSRAALNACGHLLPTRGGTPDSGQQTRRQLADELSFARCMRSHGIPNFPDPSAQGGLTVAMVQAQGIDVHSPTVLHVVQVCIPASHGGLTLAKVREAIQNASG